MQDPKNVPIQITDELRADVKRTTWQLVAAFVIPFAAGALFDRDPDSDAVFVGLAVATAAIFALRGRFRKKYGISINLANQLIASGKPLDPLPLKLAPDQAIDIRDLRFKELQNRFALETIFIQAVAFPFLMLWLSNTIGLLTLGLPMTIFFALMAFSGYGWVLFRMSRRLERTPVELFHAMFPGKRQIALFTATILAILGFGLHFDLNIHAKLHERQAAMMKKRSVASEPQNPFIQSDH